jgi:chromosome segregation ATPase
MSCLLVVVTDGVLLLRSACRADERLETEQQRVGTLENIVGQLEERMTELSEAAMAAPAASALEVGGPAAELVVTCNALRKEWKSATAALSTSRHMLSSLEQEYKDSREAIALAPA